MATEEIKKIEENCEEENKEMKKKSFGKTGFIVLGALAAGALLNRHKSGDEGDEETIIYDPNNCASLEEVEDESNEN